MEKEKSNKGLLIAVFLIIVLAIAGGVYYYIKTTSPKNVFVKQLNATLDKSNSNNSEKPSTFNKINTTLTLSGNIETTNKDVEEIAKILNDGKVKINVQADADTKKTLVGLDLDYKNESLLQAKEYYEIGDDKVYIYIQDLYDKYFKVDMTEVLNSANFGTFLNNTNGLSSYKVKDSKKANKIYNEVITENLKDEYFSKESVDGMTKNTMKISMEEFYSIYTNIYTSLKDNQEYLNCFENPESVKKLFEDAVNSILEAKKAYGEYTKDLNFEISLYTKGFSTEVKKVEIIGENSESEGFKLVINKTDINTYEYLLELKTKSSGMAVTAEALKGTVKIEKKDNETYAINLVIENVPDVGKVTLDLGINVSSNTDIQNVNVTDSVDVQKMSNNELMKLYTNLTKMKIYPYIAPYLGL